jgi:hypothetical protein
MLSCVVGLLIGVHRSVLSVKQCVRVYSSFLGCKRYFLLVLDWLAVIIALLSRVVYCRSALASYDQLYLYLFISYSIWLFSHTLFWWCT